MKKQNYLFLPITVLGATTLTAGAFLASGSTFADTSCSGTSQVTCTNGDATAKVTVASNVCSIAISNDNSYANWGDSATDTFSNMLPGQSRENLGKSRVKAQCNDTNTHYFKAVGSSAAVSSNTTATSLNGSDGAIPTGTRVTSGNTSNWTMKVSAADMSGGSSINLPTLMNGYGSYNVIPSSATSVASFQSTAANILTASAIDLRYAIYVSPTQAAGTYTGQVTISLAHEN